LEDCGSNTIVKVRDLGVLLGGKNLSVCDIFLLMFCTKIT